MSDNKQVSGQTMEEKEGLQSVACLETGDWGGGACCRIIFVGRAASKNFCFINYS